MLYSTHSFLDSPADNLNPEAEGMVCLVSIAAAEMRAVLVAGAVASWLEHLLHWSDPDWRSRILLFESKCWFGC